MSKAGEITPLPKDIALEYIALACNAYPAMRDALLVALRVLETNANKEARGTAQRLIQAALAASEVKP